jgi:guanylate kinase
MVSEDVQRLLEQLHQEQPAYKPNKRILEQLQGVTVVCFVGAACMGKTTLMDALTAYAPERYGKTRNFTSRPPRSDDDPKRYYYFDHTDESLNPILHSVDKHDLLQYNIDPFSWYVYGSNIEDYPHPYNLCDIWSSSIAGFRQLGFKKLDVFSVVTEPDSWAARLDARFAPENPLRLARLREAVQSLEWSLRQTSPDHHWVISRNGQIDQAVAHVDTTLQGEHSAHQQHAEQLAKACLERAKQLAQYYTSREEV